MTTTAPHDGHLASAEARLRAAVEQVPMSVLLEVADAGPGAERHASTVPFTGETLAQVPLSTPQDVERVVSDARAAQRSWASRPVSERAAVLLRFHDLLLDRRSEVLDLVQLETGKSRASAYEEVADVALVARHYGRRAPRYLAPRRVRGLVPGLTQVTVHRRPLGVVGVVVPWNYPLTLGAADALPALAAGNAVVLKPDLQTTLTTLWAVALLREAGVPRDVLRVVTGDGPGVGGALVDAVDQVTFTGSTPTGRMVAERAARRLVPVSLELGGKNALYVTDDVDPALAAEGAVRACFANTGQLCVSVERVVLHEAVAEAFLAEFLPRVRALRLGAALDFTADVGSLTSAAQLDRVTGHIADAVAHGAQVLAGGSARPDLGPLFLEPTVLAEVPEQAVLHREETFGPVVSVLRVPDDDAALALMDDSDYGLTAAVWTRDLDRARLLATRLRTGSVTVNEGYTAAWGSTAAPMGGTRDSGWGRRHGEEGLQATTWTQTVAVQRGVHHGLGLGRVFDRPGEQWTEWFTTALRLQRRLGL